MMNGIGEALVFFMWAVPIVGAAMLCIGVMIGWLVF